jgi:molybdate transport system permease protein
MRGRWVLAVGAVPMLLLVVVPVVALVLAVGPRGGEPSVLGRLGEPAVQEALVLSVVTTGLATLLSAVLGMPLAVLLARFRFWGREAVDTLVDLPMTVPPVVAGLALLLAFGRMGVFGGWLNAAGIRIPFTTAAVVIAQTFVAAPFFVRAARAGIEGVPVELEQAAMTLGRSPWSVFWTVTVPLARPALIAGLVLAWARALSEFGATITFAGNLPGVTQTLPLAVYGALESDLRLALSIAVVSLALAGGALVGARILGGAGR